MALPSDSVRPDGRSTSPGATPSPRPEYLLAGSIGAELSGPLLEMEHIVQHLLGTGKLSRQQVTALMASLGTARRIATQSQLLDRLAHSPIRQSHEQVALDARLRQALADNAGLLQSRAVDLVHRLQPVEVLIDPGLLETLLHAALSWMARPGYRLTVTLELPSWPPHGLLSFKARPTVSDSSPHSTHQPEPYRLSWWLLVEAAAHAQIPIQHNESNQQLTLSLEFKRTVQQLGQSVPMELQGSPDSSWSSSHARGLTSPRLLLVTADIGLQEDVEQICAASGLQVDTVISAERARRACDGDRPQMLIVDQRLNCEALDTLRQTLLTHDSRFPTVEITAEQHTLTMASWMDGAVVRISRGSLHAQLPAVLVRDLSKSD
ncbi:hypothetical protein PSQ20_18445 [Curvibacter sp. RS43]|uniref:hypothetical protein n=1 Tax=Curvibacter microcysteis TaxID=3026419 RepID=UPI0023625C5C|nr:hypothetical protein [Curvibacter sp. RS43]MDD0812337.1 hypothetical protein [Curvibacter sp. RS43]